MRISPTKIIETPVSKASSSPSMAKTETQNNTPQKGAQVVESVPYHLYDDDGKHYAVLLPSNAAGEYKVAVLSDIKGEKMNGRFSFKR